MDCSSHSNNSDAARGGRTRRPGALRLSTTWQSARLRLELWPSRLYALPVALFTFLWLRFLWRWYALVLLSGHDSSRGFLFLFGLPFLLAGISLIGTSVRLVMGRTVVLLDSLRLSVGEQALLGARAPAMLLPTDRIVEFVAESSTGLPDDERELDSWRVQVRLAGGESRALPLPVRTLVDAERVTQHLNRALDAVRQPTGYRDGIA
ncbi:MAG: hypothetical protein ABI321_19935 [Polyangia bacterium]